ncbi:hypothetical protein BDW62DRAFT_8689 [Aspergillus aurantiobrunneus]
MVLWCVLWFASTMVALGFGSWWRWSIGNPDREGFISYLWWSYDVASAGFPPWKDMRNSRGKWFELLWFVRGPGIFLASTHDVHHDTTASSTELYGHRLRSIQPAYFWGLHRKLIIDNALIPDRPSTYVISQCIPTRRKHVGPSVPHNAGLC